MSSSEKPVEQAKAIAIGDSHLAFVPVRKTFGDAYKQLTDDKIRAFVTENALPCINLKANTNAARKNAVTTAIPGMLKELVACISEYAKELYDVVRELPADFLPMLEREFERKLPVHEIFRYKVLVLAPNDYPCMPVEGFAFLSDKISSLRFFVRDREPVGSFRDVTATQQRVTFNRTIDGSHFSQVCVVPTLKTGEIGQIHLFDLMLEFGEQTPLQDLLPMGADAELRLTFIAEEFAAKSAEDRKKLFEDRAKYLAAKIASLEKELPECKDKPLKERQIAHLKHEAEDLRRKLLVLGLTKGRQRCVE